MNRVTVEALERERERGNLLNFYTTNINKTKYRKQKGITLISLSITVIILLLITGVLIYNAKDSIYIRNYKNLSNDIQNLRDKVSEFYNEYGNIPAKIKYTNISENLKLVLNNEELENIDEFYVIDLQVMNGLSLNYGKDYEKIKNNEEEVNNYQDLYIINKKTAGIFYVQGIDVKDNNVVTTYYTDYLEPNNEEVDYRYIDGVKIPDGFYYVAGNKEEGIVISDIKNDDLDNSKGGNQFVWVPVDGLNIELGRYKFGEDGEDVNFKDKLIDNYYIEEYVSESGNIASKDLYEFKRSVELYKGFYIARFEASYGVDGKPNSIISKSNSSSKPTEEGALWNNIKQSDAVSVCQKMYEGNEDIQSDLINSYAWDTTIFYIQKYGENKNYAKQKPLSNVRKNTGETGDVQCNIYDLAGNLREWTTETSTYEDIYDERPCVSRGGGYDFQDITSADSRSVDATYANGDMAFRPLLYFKIKEKWSEPYQETKNYIDENGDTAYIPKGFKISELKDLRVINKGLVIQDQEGNEYVWIKVPKDIFDDISSATDYEKIEQALIEYTKEYRQEGYEDTWRKDIGIETEQEYNELKNKMLGSIYENHGFWMGRYETGSDTYVTSQGLGDRNPVIKQGAYPLGYITLSAAQNIAENMESGDLTSSLMFGIQFDLVSKFIEENSGISKAELRQDCSSWGNYANSIFWIKKGSYMIQNQDTMEVGEWTKVNNQFKKDGENEKIWAINTTGATERNKILNIYDFVGNAWEFSLEKGPNNVVVRNAGCNNNSLKFTLGRRVSKDTAYTEFDVVPRVCIFK